MAPIEPYIPAEKSLPELTVQAVVLGLILSLIMCAANIYVGLYAGMTVSAAIPASVISMGVLRGLMQRGTILENNVVHTIASSGESLAAGIIFTVPAIVLLGIWQNYHFLETTLIAMAGGVMGVVMMIPLRRPMIIEQEELKFPEGVACAEVLKAGDRGGAEMKGVFIAVLIGMAFKSLVQIVGLFKGSVAWATRIGSTGVMVATDISPMLAAVGFIVGWEVSLLVFLGGAISYLVAMPILAPGGFAPDISTLDALDKVWDTEIRYFGIGAMVVAGLFSIAKIAPSMQHALVTAWQGVRAGGTGEQGVPRTEQGIAGRALFGLLAGCLVLSGIVYYLMTQHLITTLAATLVMFVLAFFFVAVAAYIVGLVGASNSPVSGMTICTVLVTAALMLTFGYTGTAGMLATLGVDGVVCCAACTAGDICQDLKIGQIVGATPRRLQIGEIIGTIVPALVIAPTMILLHDAYGIGEEVREGVAPLKAPQGVMFAKLVGGLFGASHIPWAIVAWGAGVGLIAILIDQLYLRPRETRFRLHPMPLAVGMYLPWAVTFPILLGGLAYWYVERTSRRRGDAEEDRQATVHRGLLFASGVVAGEALMGILTAVLMVFRIDLPLLDTALSGVLPAVSKLWSLAALLAMTAWIARIALRRRPRSDLG